MLRLMTIGVGIFSMALASAAAETPLERGRYLVDAVMACDGCHTPRPGGNFNMERRFSGGSQVWDEHAYTVRGSNISSDRETGIGSWSADDLKRLLREGVRPTGVKVAPQMPFVFYQILTPGDLDAVVTYIRSAAPVKNQVPAPVYKIALQPPVVPNAQKQMTEVDLGDKLKRGFYLATIAHCMECHTPVGPKGRDFSRTGAGGFEFKGPWGVSLSRNITSSKTKGLGGWTDDEIKRAITQGVSHDGSKLKPPMGFAFYAKMTPADLDALVGYLRTVPAME